MQANIIHAKLKKNMDGKRYGLSITVELATKKMAE